MAERQVVLDQEQATHGAYAVRIASEHLAQAEAELEQARRLASGEDASRPGDGAHSIHSPAIRGMEALKQDAMMAHLLAALEKGQDIGHYGRLVFAMVARHFLTEEELLAELTRDPDFTQEQAAVMLRQVAERDYSPPRRERIVEWQAEQEFAILPQPHDPDCGNVYRSLHFPSKTYKHIEQYQEERAAA